jgi:septal ring factor EnvC (AmiA/AmiB activator)
VPVADWRTPGSRFVAAVGALCLILALGSPPAAAADKPEQKLKTVEKALEASRQSQERYAEEAEALAAELARLREASIAAAQTAQQNEAAISQLEDQLAQLTRDEAAKSADLRRRSTQSVELLMALQRLARDPPEALAFAPGAPIDTMRSAALLGTAIPQIEAKAHALRIELAALAELRTQIDEKHGELVAQSDALAKQEIALKTLTARKAVLLGHAAHGAEISAQRLAQLSTEAADLRDLLDRIEAEHASERQKLAEQHRIDGQLLARATARPPRPPPSTPAPAIAAPSAVAPPTPATAAPAPVETAQADLVAPRFDLDKPKNLRSFSAARGAMIMPVVGKLKRRYGETDEYGAASKGILIETRPGGQVIAPFDGRIEFAGPFRGYGQILIIEHGDGYHSLLAGLERIDGEVGQWLVAGEPVGIMPTDGPAATLYLELRRHEQPINPLPWLATRDDKVSG